MRCLSDFPDAHLRIFERPPIAAPGKIRDIYLIGICGTGMGSLAGLLQQAGYQVRGSDEAAYPPMSTRLREMGIPIYEGFDAAHLNPAPDLVIVGNSCTPTHPEAAYAREQRLPQLSLPEALAHFFLNNRRSLVVAGTHGKTTTTGIFVHLFRSAGLDPSFLVGGVMVDGNVSYHVGKGPHFIIEGDEYDSAYFDKRPKFMHYNPSSAIITSMEFDHADIYDDWDDYRAAFRGFAERISPDNILALYGDDPEVRALADNTRAQVRFFGMEGEDDHVTARIIRPVSGGQEFTLEVNGQSIDNVFLPLSGRHNLCNALGVATVAFSEGVSLEAIAKGLRTFQGMKRRQEVRGEVAGVIILDDFAHHPTAVRETIRGVSERWPDRRLIAVFEPRSNSSRRKVFEQAYSESFDQASLVFISAPPLRHNDIAGNLLDKDALVRNMRTRGITAMGYPNASQLLPDLLGHLAPGDVVLVMSNGSFDGLHDRLIEALRQREANT